MELSEEYAWLTGHGSEWDQYMFDVAVMAEQKRVRNNQLVAYGAWASGKQVLLPAKGEDRLCTRCNGTYTAVRSDQRYCGPECKKKASLARRKLVPDRNKKEALRQRLKRANK